MFCYLYGSLWCPGYPPCCNHPPEVGPEGGSGSPTMSRDPAIARVEKMILTSPQLAMFRRQNRTGETMKSMDWFKGKFTGKPHNPLENLWFLVDFPLNQSIDERSLAVDPFMSNMVKLCQIRIPDTSKQMRTGRSYFKPECTMIQLVRPKSWVWLVWLSDPPDKTEPSETIISNTHRIHVWYRC